LKGIKTGFNLSNVLRCATHVTGVVYIYYAQCGPIPNLNFIFFKTIIAASSNKLLYTIVHNVLLIINNYI